MHKHIAPITFTLSQNLSAFQSEQCHPQCKENRSHRSSSFPSQTENQRARKNLTGPWPISLLSLIAKLMLNKHVIPAQHQRVSYYNTYFNLHCHVITNHGYPITCTIVKRTLNSEEPSPILSHKSYSISTQKTTDPPEGITLISHADDCVFLTTGNDIQCSHQEPTRRD